MFQNQKLKQILETSSSIKSQGIVIAEWNMNVADNISTIGNYRFRPLLPITEKYSQIPMNYDPSDAGLFYKGATDADAVVDGGIDDETDQPMLFTSKKDKEKLLYSLEDCFGKFRPRSGINKLRFGQGTSYLHHSNTDVFRRPRYYMADKDDKFKYWTSYRTESGTERGVANSLFSSQFFINDAAPFIVYKQPVPVNRVVVKMQTHTGKVDLGPFVGESGTFPDPFFGSENAAVPKSWKIQYLRNDTWVDAISFNGNESRKNGDPVIGPDGYVELEYGLIIPDEYSSGFRLVGQISSTVALPKEAIPNTAYLLKANSSDRGLVYVFSLLSNTWQSFPAQYGWFLKDDSSESIGYNFAKNLTLSSDVVSENSQVNTEFMFIRGLRIVVETMNKQDASFDLIEMSPRLAVDLSDKVTSIDVKKSASDLGVSGLPVGQLLAGVGGIEIFDNDLSFSLYNEKSIISDYVNQNIQIKIYDAIFSDSGEVFYVPLKTMYSEGFPEISNDERKVQLSLRDLFFYFESLSAPEILIQNASLSYAVSLLLDSVGFSNYVYFRNENESEDIIPFFFIPPDLSVAEVLEALAVATQSAMFFDEYNNFVIMSKNYILPSEQERSTDISLLGAIDSEKSGVYKNRPTNPLKLSDIIEISSQENQVYNDGTINYTSRYIQRSYGSIEQSARLDKSKTWVYKPALLWEVTAPEKLRSINEETGTQEAYGLSAIPLNSDLSDKVPEVLNNEIVNNILDFGEAIYWLSRHSGYFYSNGEIIKYDAVEYSISSLTTQLGDLSGQVNVWISNNQEYQKYFSRLAFNGKMYPTGRVRIYAEPNTETIDSEVRLAAGPVARHGRGQFGTTITSHSAGLSSYWTDNANIRGCEMESKYLFKGDTPPQTELGPAGVNNVLATKSSRTSLIKNFESLVFGSEKGAYELAQNVQASALVFNGPQFEADKSPVDFVSYIYKNLGQSQTPFKYFGTRMRVVGRIENNSDNPQSASGSMNYYTVQANSPEFNGLIDGGSGGLGILINQNNNNGYFLEVIGLSQSSLEDYAETDGVANVVFYKVEKDKNSNKAIPIKLWSGLAPVTVDSGTFDSQQGIVAEDRSTVIDLAIEYEQLSGSRKRFFLYMNNSQIATVVDDKALPTYNNMAVFVRGNSHCMFENLYALSNNYSLGSGSQSETIANSIFAQENISTNDSLRRYSVSGIVQSSFLSGISPAEPPKYNMFFEEFGSIMREAAYFDIKYDKAYPALYSKISPTINKNKSYTVSGYLPGSYGAEFLVFNTSDSFVKLDESSGDYLRIQGITFTQSSESSLTVDQYFAKNSDFSPKSTQESTDVSSVYRIKNAYKDIKLNRMTYGKKDFSISSPYIQTQDAANELMGWLTTKIMKPRRSIGIKIFSNPMIQLGDVVVVDHVDSAGDRNLTTASKRFVVYYMEYNRAADGPSMTVYLSEV
jgi:hypothetical protein